MKDKFDYLYRLKLEIERLHKRPACYLRTHWVDVTVLGETGLVGDKTAWVGDVEVFALTKHPKAKICYAWSRREGKNDEGERIVVVLEIPPVDSPQAAVRASIVSDSIKDH